MVKFEDLFGDDSNTEFEFNEHGDLELVEDAEEETDSDESVDSENEEADESEDTNAEDSDDDSEASDGEDDSDSSPSDNPVEARIKSLESTVDKLLDIVEKIAKVKPEQSQQVQEDDEDDDDEDFNPRKFKSSLKKMIEETIDKKVKPIEDQSAQQREAIVVDQLLKKHGDTFKAAVPFMKELLAVNPALGVQKAWEAYQRAVPTKATPKATKQNGDSKTVKKKTGDAADLRKKAANLETPKGANSGTQKAEKRAGNLNDTIADSWDEVFNKRG